MSQNFEIPASSIQMERGFVSTYRCHTKKGIVHGKEVIIKKLINQVATPNEMKTLKDEISSIRSIAHKNLDMIVAACLITPNISVITEYEACGDLHSLLHKESFEMDPSTSIKICRGICEGMLYLHDHQMNHFNLKSSNVLVCYAFL